jgi:transposase
VPFVAALDTASRCEWDGQVTSYLGLVPQEYSSGEKQRRGRVVRSAQPHPQSLLVRAAWRMARRRSADGPVKHMGAGGSAPRGKKVATVALARRLARILFAMWRDETDYQPERIRSNRPAALVDMTVHTPSVASA